MSTDAHGGATESPLVRQHLVFGWWCLLVFLLLGMLLEAMHGLKVGWYLDVSNHTRRLMFTLAHTHGALLSLVNIAYAVTLQMACHGDASRQNLASKALIAATILMPGGFLAGGVVIWGGDPGLGIVLVPIGAFLLAASVALTAIGLRQRG